MTTELGQQQEVKTFRELYSDGYNFYFTVGEHQVHAWGSAKSGSEKVYVDGELVSEQRSFRKQSVHHFDIDSQHFEIEFQNISLSTGELHCTLIKDGTHVETQKLIPKLSKNKKANVFWTVFGFIGGAVLGFAFVHLMFKLFID